MGCNLITHFDGDLSGQAPIWLVLHDRYGDLDAARRLGARLGDDVLRVAVQAARMQTEGGLGHVRGHFWYIGPVDMPELSTFGDGLAELDALLIQLRARYPHARFNLLGQGEGATLAMMLALVYGDLVDKVIVINAHWPKNFDRMPITVADPLNFMLVAEGDCTMEDCPLPFRAQGA